MIHRLEELDPAGLEARLAATPALVLALGTIEWHSHHLPLGLDLLKAQAIAERAAERSGAVLAPPAWWAAAASPQPYTLRLPARRHRARAGRRPPGPRGDGVPRDLRRQRPLRPGELDRSPPRGAGVHRCDRRPARRLRAAHRPRRDGRPRGRLRDGSAAAGPPGPRRPGRRGRPPRRDRRRPARTGDARARRAGARARRRTRRSHASNAPRRSRERRSPARSARPRLRSRPSGTCGRSSRATRCRRSRHRRGSATSSASETATGRARRRPQRPSSPTPAA